MLKVVYYVDSSTDMSPVRHALEKVQKKSVKRKIMATVKHVANNRGFTSYVVVKKMRGYHFSEVRIKFSRNLYRVLYIVWHQQYMVLLHMFSKKEGEETPERELRVAEQRYQDFIIHQRTYE